MWASNVVEARRHAVALVETGLTVSEAARLAGVSRQCLHKWLERVRREGLAGLEDRSRAAKRHRYAVSEEMVRRVLRLRRRFKEGPKKLRLYLQQECGGRRVPAASTIGLILKDHDLVQVRPRRRRQGGGPARTLTEAQQPNDVWCIDFKGEFGVGGQLCYPLTLTDAFSRYALAVRAFKGTRQQDTRRSLWRAFRRYGLPNVIRCDNGTPFVAALAPAGLTRLSASLVRLGVRVERIDPGKPYQNGRHERFHLTLKQATALPPACSWSAQQMRFNRFRTHYNERRPHESLAMKPPASAYQPSSRVCPNNLPPIEHIDAHRVVQLNTDGGLHFRGRRIHLSLAIAHETVALRELECDIYAVTYGPLYLGCMNYRLASPQFIRAP